MLPQLMNAHYNIYCSNVVSRILHFINNLYVLSVCVFVFASRTNRLKRNFSYHSNAMATTKQQQQQQQKCHNNIFILK